MKTKVFFFGIVAMTISMTILSCSSDAQDEDLNELEQLERTAIEADEVTEDDT